MTLNCWLLSRCPSPCPPEPMCPTAHLLQLQQGWTARHPRPSMPEEWTALAQKLGPGPAPVLRLLGEALTAQGLRTALQHAGLGGTP